MKIRIYLVFALVFALTCTIPVFAAPAEVARAFSCTNVTEIPPIECEALVALYNSTNGDGWNQNDNWLVTNTPSDWYGVYLNGGNVTFLYLWNNSLKGSIPPEIGNLTSLIYLFLENNSLNGNLPPELGNLTVLHDLNLSYNQLSGNLPPELGNLTNLEWLYLNHNQLTGSIPPELGNLTNLEWLYLNHNQLTGSIPPEIGNLNSLICLFLENNSLYGSLPPEMSNLSSLQTLDLAYNHLSGSLPAELSNILVLVDLNLSHNKLSGSLPPELAKLWFLSKLNLSHNRLSGSIPRELGNLISMQKLYLGGNQLSGSIPPELLHLTFLNELDLSGNQLSGNIPPELGIRIYLRVLWLQDNQLSGDIPATFINLIDLYDAGQYNGRDGLNLDSNLLNIPPGYPDPNQPFQVFLSQKDPNWQFYQGFEQVVGAGGGALASLDGRTDILIPPGALDGDTTFTFIPKPEPYYDHPRLGFTNQSFTLVAEDAGSNPMTEFNLPITVTITYADVDFGRMTENLLGLYYWDNAASTWADAVSTCPAGAYTRDLDGNQLALPLCHLTEFGLFGMPLNVFLPVVRQ